jgi:hypothetical protein
VRKLLLLLGLAFMLLGALLCAAQNTEQNNEQNNQQNGDQQGTQQNGEQPLGNVARAQRQKKPAAKVIDDDDMAQRRAQRGLSEASIQCDADCAAAVKAAILQDGQIHITEEQWQTALGAGEDELATDDDWSQMLPEIQQQVCQNHAIESDKGKDLDRRVNKKFIDDARDSMDAISHAMEAGTSKAAVNQAVDGARAKAVKMFIVKTLVERARKSCPVAAPVAKTIGQPN